MSEKHSGGIINIKIYDVRNMGVDGVTKRMNPIVDFVFKRIFGTEENKDLLLSFLNATLKPEEGNQLKG